jgi:pimeloyl-ACP methyl ester carboxylesterase
MPFVTVRRENSAAIQIYFEDHGSGSPVVLVHGYALNGHSWEKQEAALLAAGHRVITYDRRGFGASSRPSTGYDFDTLAGDLHVLLSTLDLRGVVLAGFAMGTGEVARYLAVHGQGRVKAAVLVAPLLPFLLKTHDSPDGIERSVFDGLTARLAADRPAVMKDFLDRSYNVDLLGGDRVSDQAWQNSFYAAHLRLGPRRPPLRHRLPGRLPGGPRHDQHPRPGHPRRPGSRPALPRHQPQASRVAEEHPLHHHHWRPARDHLDPRRRGQPGTARLHRPPGPGRQAAQRSGEPAPKPVAERAGRLTFRCTYEPPRLPSRPHG